MPFITFYLKGVITLENNFNILEQIGKQNMKNNGAHEGLQNIMFDKVNTINKLKTIWKEILKVEDVGVDDYFYNLGGHSLLAMALELHIEKEFNVPISLSKIFKNLTINELAKHIEEQHRSDYSVIKPLAKKEYYPLTYAQKGIYVLEQRIGKSKSFNLPIIRVIEGCLDRNKLENVFNTIIQRHSAFRTYFEVFDGKPIQKVSDGISFQIEYVDEIGDTEEGIMRRIESLIQPFDIAKAPLFRVALLNVNDNKNILVIDMHHIISDGISIGLLFNEISNLYNDISLPEIQIQYADYAAWQDEVFEKTLLRKMEEFWLEYLSGDLPKLNLPYDDISAFEQDYEGDAQKLCLSVETTLKLKNLANSQGVTLFTLIFSLFSLILSKYSNQDDIIIGSIAAGRNHANLENIIGMFVNVVPIRTFINQNINYIEFLSSIKETIIKVFENQEYPIEKMVENLKGLPYKAKYATNPLFGTLVNFHTETDIGQDIRLNNLNVYSYEQNRHNSRMDILLDIYLRDAGELFCIFEYNTKLFKKDTIKRIIESFVNVVDEVIQDPYKKILDISLLSKDAESRILKEFNNSYANYPYSIPLNKMIELQTETTPDNVALILDDNKLTYRELNARANKLAWFLKDQGIKENSVVGVLFERSFEMIIAILAILKAGGAYLPLDISYPLERINYMIDNSNVSLILTHDALSSSFDKVNCQLISVNEIIEKYSLLDVNLNLTYNPERLMYVLYTSGSTGKPKGVMIKAHAFVNLIYWYTNEFVISDKDCNLLVAPISFDLAQKNLYATLIKGGCISLYPNRILDYNIVSNIIKEHGVTIINCTPSAFYPLIDTNLKSDFRSISTLRYVFLGGEPINVTKLLLWIESKYCCAEIVNTYGPTECTDIVAYYKIDNKLVKSGMTIPIGKPIYNTNLYILDKNQNLLPIGVDGELYVSGIGLAKGYYNMPELTENKFINLTTFNSERVYRTGDIARWLPDGNIEFRGREDHQVKIRGYRIELGEIENRLLQHNAIKEAVVVAKGELDDKYLCAYLVSEEELNANEIKQHLANELPDYMIPIQFIQLEHIPLNPNGKIDIKKLLSLKQNENIGTVEASENETEEKLVKIWGEILKIEKLSVTDNFFEIGGHSLRAIMLVSKIEKQLGVIIPLNIIFDKPTIKDIARYIDENANTYLNNKTFDIDIDDTEFNF